MRDLLARGNRPVLRELATRRTLLAFDFDGTLAPIVDRPADASLRPRTARLLRTVAGRWPCAVVSGRSRADVLSRLGGAPLRWVLGNHGAEGDGRADRAAVRALVRGWLRPLRQALRDQAGVQLEDKGLSLSVHYRRASRPAAARRAAVRAARGLRGARLVPGKMVLNVVPAGAPDKGMALEALVRRGRFGGLLFVGDDVTDEAVFRRRFAVPAVTVQVGHRRGAGARFWVRGDGGVDELLALLARARDPAGPGAPPSPRRRRPASAPGGAPPGARPPPPPGAPPPRSR